MESTLMTYSAEDLQSCKLAEVGDNVLIDRSVRFYGAEFIRIGSNVRIDAYCVLSAGPSGIYIGSYVHLAVGVTILGAGKVVIEDFCGLSARVAIFSSNDDYSGGAMAGPMIPDEFRNVKIAPVVLRRHALVGSGSVILPGVTIGVGASVGALSVVNKSVPDLFVVSGSPLRKIGKRDARLFEYETRFLNNKRPDGEL